MLIPVNKPILFCLCVAVHSALFAQYEVKLVVDTQWHQFPNGTVASYTKPKSVGFLIQVPGDAALNLPAGSTINYLTGALLQVDN
jgi:hypothetical protein